MKYQNFLYQGKIYKIFVIIIRLMSFFLKNEGIFDVSIKSTREKIKFFANIKNQWKYKYPTLLMRVFGIYEPLTSKFLKSYLNKNQTILEIGAAYGYFSIQMCNRAKFVHSIEPSEIITKYLKQNLEINNIKNSKIHNIALGKANSQIFLPDEKNPIKTYSIDEFFLNEKVKPDFIFIDADAVDENKKRLYMEYEIIKQIVNSSYLKKVGVFFETKKLYEIEQLLHKKFPSIQIKRITNQHFFFEINL